MTLLPNASALARIALIAIATLAACGSPGRPPDVDVEVFAADTTEVAFRVVASDGLIVGLRSERYYMQGGRTLRLTTPRAFVIRGAGSALITVSDTSDTTESAERIVVQPVGNSPDSAERAAVVGRVIRLTRGVSEARVAIELERP